MVKSTTYEPDYARDWLDQAERKWRTANREEHPVDKCENLQASMERALKALIVAQGRASGTGTTCGNCGTRSSSTASRSRRGRTPRSSTN